MNKCNFRPAFVAGIFSLFLVNIANAWTIDQSYDSLSNGAKCPGWGSTQSVISSDKSASGGKSCKQKITGGEFGFGEWGGILAFPEKLLKGDEVWIRVRNYFPVGFDYSADPWLKFLRVSTNQSNGDNRGYNDWYINKKGDLPPFRFIYEGRQDLAWHKVGEASHAIKLGVWETYEFYIKFDTKSVDEGGSGRMRAWKNGVLMKDMTDRATLNSATDYSERLHIFTYWNDSTDPVGAPKSQSSYIDDVVITNERPLNTDSFGNSAIGMGGYVPARVSAPPRPPVLIQSTLAQ